MAKKNHADIMEKLSALKPSEPTRTRDKSPRKPAAKPVNTGKAAPPRKPKAKASAAAPEPAATPRMEPLFPGQAGYVVLGDASQMIQGIYDNWFRILRNCSGAAAECNDLFLRSLSYFMVPGRWWRL